MGIISEFAIIFAVCFVGEGISAMLPFAFPGSVISMLILLLLLLSGALKENRIDRASSFLLENTGLFFLPAGVGIMNYFDVLRSELLPVLIIIVLTTPLVYAAAAWSVQLVMRLMQRTGAGKND